MIMKCYSLKWRWANPILENVLDALWYGFNGANKLEVLRNYWKLVGCTIESLCAAAAVDVGNFQTSWTTFKDKPNIMLTLEGPLCARHMAASRAFCCLQKHHQITRWLFSSFLHTVSFSFPCYIIKYLHKVFSFIDTTSCVLLSFGILSNRPFLRMSQKLPLNEQRNSQRKPFDSILMTNKWTQRWPSQNQTDCRKERSLRKDDFRKNARVAERRKTIKKKFAFLFALLSIPLWSG